MKLEQVVIIGAGPAGLAAAIQLKRYAIPFVLLEKERVGGLLWNANLVENYPGFPAGISGPKLVKLIQKQIQRIGVEITPAAVFSVQKRQGYFLVGTKVKEYSARCVLVATGTKPNPIPRYVPGDVMDKVFTEVYPLRNMKDKHIVIVGAGDAAFDYALNLTKNRNSVTILNRGEDVKCLRLLWDRALANPSVAYLSGTPVREVDVQEPEGRLRVRTEAGQTLVADHLLFATGRVPQTDYLSDELLRQPIAGLYFAGDIKNGMFRQAAIAAGDGLRAAMEIYNTLKSEAQS